MDQTQSLIGVAEVAIALAGFSGVVVVFRRSEDPWLPEDQFRLTMLIFISFSTAGFAFLPLVLWEIAGTEHNVWRASSAFWSIYMICFIGWARSFHARLRAEDPAMRERLSPLVLNVMLYGISPFFVVLSLANAASWGAFTAYLAVLVFGLATSGIQFARILQSALR
ncbi:MAG: hypothetical protein JRG94_01220 [Deltaproteobacteria bacterium]|nr:hypothetical protein [Deltaproteobacteria bacterium]